MTTSTHPTEDIIELTEIVEEGIPLDKKFEGFDMGKAVDATSLDQELDDLLRDAEIQPKAAQKTEDEIDLDILFDEPEPVAEKPQPSPAAPKTQAPDQGMDLSDLDDLFDSLGIGEKEDGDTALDIILDGDIPDPKKQSAETFYPSDSIDLELELPGMEGGKKSDIQDLTEDLLADIPETVLLQSPEEPLTEPAVATPPPVSEEPTAEPEDRSPVQEARAEEQFVQAPAPGEPFEEPDSADNEPEAESTEQVSTLEKPAEEPLKKESTQEQMPAPALPVAEAPVLLAPPLTAEPAISHAELEIISGRLDALESRPAPLPAPGAEDLLALLPVSPQDLPLARTLRQEILDHIEVRVAELAESSKMEGLQKSLNDLQRQVDSMPDIESELAKLPNAASLQHVNTGLDELRALVLNREELQSEQILPLLPQSPQGWPVAQALRQEIVDHVEARISELASSASVDGLQESVNALQSQLESMPDIRAELAKTLPASAMQKMETELEDLRALVRVQEESLNALRQALADRDTSIAALNADGKGLREELESIAARADTAPAIDGVRAELREYVQQQVPLAAAKIIREEIQALLRELGS